MKRTDHHVMAAASFNAAAIFYGRADMKLHILVLWMENAPERSF